MPFRLYCLLIGTVLATVVGATEVYRTVGPNGEVHYTDEPPSKDAKPVQLPPIQVVSPPQRPASSAAPAVAGVDLTGSAPLSATILSPTPDQAVRGTDGQLPVTVSLARPLPEGYGLMYLLDGSPQTDKPTRHLNFTFDGVEPGEHLISVVTLDPRGTEVGRAAPVIVHMKSSAGANVERPRAEAAAGAKQNQKPKTAAVP